MRAATYAGVTRAARGGSKPAALSTGVGRRDGEQPGNQRAEHPLQLPGQGEQGLYLVAAMLSLETPLAKMLAVIAEHAVTVLAHPGTCAAGSLPRDRSEPARAIAPIHCVRA
jgi:hypothetical protein